MSNTLHICSQFNKKITKKIKSIQNVLTTSSFVGSLFCFYFPKAKPILSLVNSAITWQGSHPEISGNP